MVKLEKKNNLVYYYVKCIWNEKQCGILVDATRRRYYGLKFVQINDECVKEWMDSLCLFERKWKFNVSWIVNYG
jgi:hypothetical protein